MLLGEGYGSSKCVNVVRMITGCSRNLVASVSNYLQVNQSTGRPPSNTLKSEADRQQREHNHAVPQQNVLHHQGLHIPPMDNLKSTAMQLAQAAQQMSMGQGMGMGMMYGQPPQYSSAPPLPPVLSNLVTATINHPAQMTVPPPPQQQQLNLFYGVPQK